jgi:hypothetical protein
MENSPFSNLLFYSLYLPLDNDSASDQISIEAKGFEPLASASQTLCASANSDHLHDITTGLRNLSRKEFLVKTIPLPPFPTQQHIASKLKEKITQAGNLKAAIEKQRDTIKALPQAILRKAFSEEM